jgi:microcin C transport system permease protein
MAQDRFLFFPIRPITRRRIANFKKNRRGYWSLWIFLALLVISLPAEFIANDKPLLVRFDGAFYVPVLWEYPETEFGGFFPTEADYTDPVVVDLIEEGGWLVWPIVPYAYDTHIAETPGPAPTPPTADNWLGTDDKARDVVARLIYGFRISVLFGLILTVLSSIVGVAVGAIQGFFGGLTDLIGQRLIEIWSGMPVLFLLIILASIAQRSCSGMYCPMQWWRQLRFCLSSPPAR